MSQAGIVDIEGSHPQIPTQFDCNSGFAVPIANVLEILGEAVPAANIPLETVGSGNTVTIEVQYASDFATSEADQAGIASFNSTDFTVDANGFVTLVGSASVENFTVDAHTSPGTNPVVPNGSGNITVTGGQVAAGTTTHVIQTNSLAVNSYTIQVQRSQAVASSTVGDNGVCHFNSTYFSVDANGFVTLVGGSVSASIQVDAHTSPGTNPVVPNGSGTIIVTGGQVAAGTTANVIQTNSLAVNTYTIQVQRSQAVASSTVGDNGVCHFNSAQFTVDGNGFVSSSAVTGVSSVTGTANQILASPTTGAVVLSLIGPYTPATYTAHGVLVGEGTSSIVAVGPTANTGAVLQNNSGADPTYSTATYPSTTTINQILYSNAANTVTGLATANSAVLVTGSTGVPVFSSTMINGQVIIGSTGATPTAANLSAGTGVTITNGAGTIQISASGTSTLNYTPVNHAASPYTVVATDQYLGVNSTAGVVSILLPNAPATGRTYVIKDSNGQAATNNITVTTVGGSVTIDGATSYVMKTNYQAIQVIFNGTSYEVF
jgi:trimeric autotransporter adhesin